MGRITTSDLVAWTEAFAQEVEGAQRRLSELDAATGDADHGANLVRGIAALRAEAAQAEALTPGVFLKQAGLAMVDNVGGSSGALYGTVFLRMASTAGLEAEAIDGLTMARALRAAAQGITDRGCARLGDKTMLDALDPAATAFAQAIEAGREMAQAWAEAARAAEAGAAATAAMRARRGKSSYVGEKSIGTVDPGAASIALLIAAAARSMGAGAERPAPVRASVTL